MPNRLSGRERWLAGVRDAIAWLRNGCPQPKRRSDETALPQPISLLRFALRQPRKFLRGEWPGR
ncbi:hypothetical protein [Rhodoplanes sp. SY1]|uniref:hypothetical protein n=1 Tax=Rhodoplanes sp. SY1 TaxID=3166646 RepID=UPI0038B69EA5